MALPLLDVNQGGTLVVGRERSAFDVLLPTAGECWLLKTLLVNTQNKCYLLITSKGELLIYKTLWETAPSERKEVFEKEVISPHSILIWIEFETSTEVSNSSIWKYTTCATKVFFSYINIHSQLWRPIELNSFAGLLFYALCWDKLHQVSYTNWEDWSPVCSAKNVETVSTKYDSKFPNIW